MAQQHNSNSQQSQQGGGGTQSKSALPQTVNPQQKVQQSGAQPPPQLPQSGTDEKKVVSGGGGVSGPSGVSEGQQPDSGIRANQTPVQQTENYTRIYRQIDGTELAQLISELFQREAISQGAILPHMTYNEFSIQGMILISIKGMVERTERIVFDKVWEGRMMEEHKQVSIILNREYGELSPDEIREQNGIGVPVAVMKQGELREEKRMIEQQGEGG